MQRYPTRSDTVASAGVPVTVLHPGTRPVPLAVTLNAVADALEVRLLRQEGAGAAAAQP